MSTRKCCLKSCCKDIEETASRVEVKTVLPSKWKTANHFIISWKVDGEAQFHSNCWEYVLKRKSNRANQKASKKGNHKQDDELCGLHTQEKALVKEAEKTAEFFDSTEKVQNEAKRIAKMITTAKHCVAFTGAGISTAAGIGDYRGKSGKWTEMDQVKASEKINTIYNEDDGPSVSKKSRLSEENTDKSSPSFDQEGGNEDDGVSYEVLRPTYTHEALCKLVEQGLVKHIISQNGDGLHGLSGIPQKCLSELHGNVFIEKCENCKHVYHRSYYVMDDEASQYYEDLEDYGKSDLKKPKHAAQCHLCGLSHRTGRKCEQKGCKGFLKDTIINFRDNLEEDILDAAFEHAYNCVVMICLGSTLTVTPANSLVEVTQDPKTLVICNRQKTDYDEDCQKIHKGKQLGSRIFADCDVLMKEIMKNILDQESLDIWEYGRSERMKMYDAQRTVV